MSAEKFTWPSRLSTKSRQNKRRCSPEENGSIQRLFYEIGPGESLEDVLDTAVLLQKIEGEEEVEKMDALLSLAITGGVISAVTLKFYRICRKFFRDFKRERKNFI